MANIRGKAEIVTDFFFLDSKITVDSHCSHKIRRQLLLGRKVIANLDSVLKGRDITVGKGQDSQSYGLPCGHIWLWELDCKEGRLPKNWCLQTVVLEKITENPVYRKEIKPVNLKAFKLWILFGRSWCWSQNSSILGILCEQTTLWESPWCWEGLRAEGKEGIKGWDGCIASRCNGRELGQTSGDGEGQGGLACYSPWDHK